MQCARGAVPPSLANRLTTELNAAEGSQKAEAPLAASSSGSQEAPLTGDRVDSQATLSQLGHCGK